MGDSYNILNIIQKYYTYPNLKNSDKKCERKLFGTKI